MRRHHFVLAIAISTPFFAAAGESTTLDHQREALSMISNAADRICTRAATGGSTHVTNASASVDLELTGLLRRLATAGVDVKAQQAGEAHEGVLKDQVLAAASEADQCKTHVFDVLSEKLLPLTTSAVGDRRGPRSSGTASLQDVLLVATHPTSVSVSGLQFSNFFEDGGAPFLTVSLRNDSEIPATALTVEVMNLKSGSSFPALKPLKLRESQVLRRLGSKAVSIDASATTNYPLVSVSDLLAVVHPEVDGAYCPYDASVLLANRDDMMKSRLEAIENMPPPDSGSETTGVIASSRPTEEIGTLLRIKYRTIFNQHVTSYVTVFVDYADTRVSGDVWYPSENKFDSLHCVDAVSRHSPPASM